MANGASTMCSHCTHLIRGIILGSCWTEKRLIENMIFQLVWRSRSWIKIYILWNHTFYVFFCEKSFKRLHITDIGLIWFWLRSQISWGHIDRKQCSQQWEIFNGGWIFPIVLGICFGIYLTIYRYHIRLHPFIQRYNSKEWITLDRFHPTITMIEFCKQTDMENHFWAGWYRYK